MPKFDELIKPILLHLGDGNEHRSSEIKDVIAEEFGLSNAEIMEQLLSGQTRFDNRIGWAKTYLKKAGLVSSPSRYTSKITSDGLAVLKENPKKIDSEYLEKFESFREFQKRKKGKELTGEDNSSETEQDTIDRIFENATHALEDDLLARVMKQSPAFFEWLVIRLLEKIGYGGTAENSGIVTGRSGDEGIDGMIKEDKLGFELIYVQAKKWEKDTSIGRQEIQKFVGALAGQGASKGLFITTAKFTKEAKEYVSKQHTARVVLVDGAELVKLMIEYNLGVSIEFTYETKKVDTDFFDDP